MHTAQQIKSAHTITNPANGAESYKWNDLYAECDQRGNAARNWENESTEYDFPDGSVLIMAGPEVRAYGAR